MAGFAEKQNEHHKIRGMQRAIHSAKTPAHLKPHLRAKVKEHAMAQNPKAGFNPKTGAQPQMSPKFAKNTKSGRQAESRINQPPSPFKNPLGPANLPAPSGPAGAQSIPNPAFHPSGVKKSAPKRNFKAVGDKPLKTKSKVAGSAFYGE